MLANVGRADERWASVPRRMVCLQNVQKVFSAYMGFDAVRTKSRL